MGKSKQHDPAQAALAKERAYRIRKLRNSLHYSRKDLEQKYREKYGITESALNSWESVRWKGLTESGAHKLVDCFKEEGLNITVEWLMYGTGIEDPFHQAFKLGLAHIVPESASRLRIRAEEPRVEYRHTSGKNVERELKAFHALNPGSVDAMVSDDGMLPTLAPGDHVGGLRYFDKAMERGINHPCIIQTLSGSTLIRLLKPGHDIGYYTLLCTNPHTTVHESVTENIQLFSVAPITWIHKSADHEK